MKKQKQIERLIEAVKSVSVSINNMTMLKAAKTVIEREDKREGDKNIQNFMAFARLFEILQGKVQPTPELTDITIKVKEWYEKLQGIIKGDEKDIGALEEIEQEMKDVLGKEEEKPENEPKKS